MALTPGRWLALLGTGCMALAVLLLPPRGTGVIGLGRLFGTGFWNEAEYITGDSLRFRRYHLSQAIGRTEARLEAIRLRDSLVAPVKAARGSVSVAPLPGVPATAVVRARALAASVEPHLGSSGPLRYRIVVALLPEQREWQASSLLYLPGTVAADACVVTLKKKALDPGDLRPLIAPCVLYATFGVPGDSIAGWLSRRGFDVARDYEWWTPAPLPAAGSVDVAWWSSRTLALAFSGEWPAWMDLDRAACQGGDAEACARAFLSPRRSRLAASVGDRVFALVPPSQYRWWESENPARDGMLAELIREFGAERFAAFWHSSRPVEQAFADVFGEPLASWAVRWSQRRLGTTYSGPVIRWGGVLSWIAVAGLALTLSLAAATRRQVA